MQVDLGLEREIAYDFMLKKYSLNYSTAHTPKKINNSFYQSAARQDRE